MQLFVEQLINGVALGSLYALFGIGFGLSSRPLGILNTAHGTYASWAAIVGLACRRMASGAVSLGRCHRHVGGGLIALIVDQVGFPAAAAARQGHAGGLDHQHCLLDHSRQSGRHRDRPSKLGVPRGHYPGGLIDFGPIRVPQMQIIIIAAMLIVGGRACTC